MRESRRLAADVRRGEPWYPNVVIDSADPSDFYVDHADSDDVPGQLPSDWRKRDYEE